MKNKILIFYLFVIGAINNMTIAPLLLLTMPFTKYFLLKYYNIFMLTGSYLVRLYYNVKVYVSNKNLMHDMLDNNNKEHSIVISNHMSQFDFLYFYNLLAVKNYIQSIQFKFVAFYYLYLFPGVGILAYLTDCIQISNNKKRTIDNMNNCKLGKNDIFFIYPEGSTYRQSYLDKSNEYCDKNNIERTKLCLYPRDVGLNIIDKNNNINTIYSLWMQFDKPHEKDYYGVIQKDIPKTVYIKLNKHLIENMNISNKTIEIFRDIDTHLLKGLDKNDYELLEPSYCEKLCLLSYTSLFSFLVYALYESSYFRYYLSTTTTLYYLYLYYHMKV